MRIVAIGGGTGLPAVLRGLKRCLYPDHGKSRLNGLTAIVTATHNGGSSGRLKRDLNILPPRDIRNCLLALANTNSILPDLFKYRFTKSKELNHHSMGDLILAALSELTQNFEYAINITGGLLGINGRVLPSTLERVELGARLKDRRIMWGQSVFTKGNSAIEKVFLRPKDPSPLPQALKAIATADAIILGPGSLYTSLIPNLLLRGVVEAISKSFAKKIFVMNLMTQCCETDGYTAEDHLDAIIRHCGQPIFDYVILNTKRFGTSDLKEYQKGCMPVTYHIKRIVKNGLVPIEEDVASETKICHDPDKLAKTIISIIGKKDAKAKDKGLTNPAGEPPTSNVKALAYKTATLGRIPNMDLSEPCINCLWLERDRDKNECANRGTAVCPFYREEIFRELKNP